MQKPDIKLISIINRIASGAAGVVAILLPIGYFAIVYQYETASLDTEVEINAYIITQLINKNPEMWRFEHERLAEFMARRPNKGNPEIRRILDNKNNTVVESRDKLKAPFATRAGNLMDSGRVVGSIEISRSLRPLLINTGLISLLGLLLGSAVFFTLRTFPARAEKALRQSEERYRSLVENARDVIYTISAEGTIASLNPAFEEISGWEKNEWLGKHFTHIIHPADLPFATEVSHRVLNGETPPTHELRIQLSSGAYLVGEFTVTPLMQDGKVVGILGIARDITGRKLFEQQLEKKNRELESAYEELKKAQSRILQQEKMASIGQLAAGVAHEINNPTGFIMSNLGSLQKYADRLSEFITAQSEALRVLSNTVEKGNGNLLAGIEELRKTLKINYIVEDTKNLIKESLDGTDRIKRIVRDLKSFSHTDDAAHKMADINSGMESTINIVWNELKYKASVKKEFGNIPMTKCNPGQLNQVFMNILVNAAHAIEKQGEITVKTWREGEHIHISIADTGCGIPEDKLGKIFEPFFTTKEVGKGTGLGLSIAYDIVKKHNGEIKVESEINKGTTFIVRIPLTEREQPYGDIRTFTTQG
ncbi:MAG: PAS domain S-box protein [Nitrospirae bacterium]|nr:PAS domain S-box protein [Nitrospirota bacterium]